MESKFTLKATDKQAQQFFDTYSVKLMEFKGDKEKFPEMDYESDVIHPWAVLLRHADEIGKINGVRTYDSIIKLLNV